MPKVSAGNFAVEIVKNAKPLAAPLFLAAFGIYGGQYAAKFIAPFNWYASGLCLMALSAGVIWAIIVMITSSPESLLKTLKHNGTNNQTKRG